MTRRAELQQQPDVALIRRFLDGEEAAFRALYARHTPRLRMLVWRMLGPRCDDTDDVLQETWLAGCRGIHLYRGDAKFSSWLTTIGIRAACNRYGVPWQDDASIADVATDASFDTPATSIDLERALARLPDHQRAVVVLHDVEGFTHEEIAQQLGVAVGTSKATLSRARGALRRMLNDGVSYVR